MNCQDFELVVLAPARKESLDAHAHETGRAHMETCPACASRFANEQLLFSGVRSVVAELERQQAPPNVEAALLVAFRERAARKASANVIEMPRTSTRRIWRLAAVAAAILILLSGLAMLWPRSNAPGHKDEAITPPPPSLPGAPSPAPEHKGEIGLLPDAPTPPRRRPRHQVSASHSSETEVVTDFFPLVEGHDVESVEGAQIVRIALPGSAVTEVGLPGSAESSRETVEADVLLGPDGLARAIRFVRSDSQR